MNLLILGVRNDEIEIFHKYNKNIFDMTFTSQILTKDNIDIVCGFEAVSIIASCNIDAKLAKMMADRGIKYILSRTAGKDHINIEAVHKYGMRAANVPSYSPNSISEFTIMITLELLRKSKLVHKRLSSYNLCLPGIRGSELKNKKVCVIGIGKIGKATIQNLSGFGCSILAVGHHIDKEVEKYVKYVEFEQAVRESDIVILHCQMNDINYHMIDEETIKKMKDGVFLINTARGALVDSDAAFKAVKTGKIAGYAMDVYEYENTYQRKDYSGTEIENKDVMDYIRDDNIIFTPHIAFYTDEAVENIISTTFSNLNEFITNDNCLNEL